MSIVEELGAQVRAAADELPVGLVGQALDRLRAAGDRLRWVRQESVDPLGVPELSAATEHAETANHVLRVAQEQLANYLTAIGLGGQAAPGAAPTREPVMDQPQGEIGQPAPGAATSDDPGPLRRWWALRVSELTGGAPGQATEPDRRVTDAGELLRQVARDIRSGDRGRLHSGLRDVDANVGLGMAALAPPVLRDLATDLLGHPPRSPDLPRLRRELSDAVHDLLPGLPPTVLDTLLTRVCRMPPTPTPPDQRPHPADPAVTAGVLTGLLLRKLGRDDRALLPHLQRELHG